MKHVLLFTLLAFSVSIPAQLAVDQAKLKEAGEKIAAYDKAYRSCHIRYDLDSCRSEFVKLAANAYEKTVVANLLFNSSPATSLKLHKESYTSNPYEAFFVLEYAISLHKNGQYEAAAKLYETAGEFLKTDYRIYVWLADCYINMDQVDKSILNWKKADHPKNHIGIEEAIHEIYGLSNQFKQRNDHRKALAKGDLKAAYSLVYLDLNWEYDWWNKSAIADDYLEEDIRLIDSKLTKNSMEYKAIHAYLDLTKSGSTSKDDIDAKLQKIMDEDSLFKDKNSTANIMRKILRDAGIILDGKPLPKNGKILSGIMEICFMNGVVDEKEFYKSRGEEILKLSGELKDVAMLNLYAYLTPVGETSKAIDYKGWKEFHDERFAFGYLFTKAIASKLTSTDPELEQAINDFPNSSKIYLLKTRFAMNEKKPAIPYLKELIRKEFKSIDSGIGMGSEFGIGHSSYALKFYYGELEKAK